ncbi:L,D-transpeptidase/peptidoglycan binding protein [Lactonifactor longoviformis]|uniref:L,D-transpeptidase family protein n=1 Tax=Lactonifactor longoviformis TaxID=341220 RepID=UPI00210BB267|nr:L,D-transpeptidase family protein [Lactonifactor longoviformis]MCQ4671387.1 L,D-transpeptidase/peptidoglycan binding protein [Lactonifactor longoviformis]
MSKKKKKLQENRVEAAGAVDPRIDEAMAKIVQDTIGNDTVYDQPKKKKNRKATKASGQKSKMKKKKSKNTALKVTGIVAGVIVLLAGAAYGVGAYYYHDKFFKGTEINGINCENMTVEETEDLIRRQVEDYKITVQFRGDQAQEILGSDIGYQYVSNGDAEKILKEQNPLLWIRGYFKPEKYEAAKNISFDENQLRTKLDSLDSMIAENQEAPQDAYVTFQETEFVIVDEVQGTTIDENTMFEAVKTAVSESRPDVSAEEAGAYAAPSVTKDNPDLIAQRDMLNTYAKASITYTFGEQTELLDGSIIKDWFDYDENGNIIENEDTFKANAKEYVKSLAAKYDTVGKERSFHSTAADADITVKGGSYGWKINQKKEVAQLIEEIKAGTVTTREPIYSSTAVSREGNEIGNTYVEVDLGNQHMWFYKDGQLIVDSDFVSGNMSYKDRVTPSGVYSLYYKQRDKTLRGKKNPDGTYEYESPVKYWMPFNGGVGLHDASWRSNFGGNIYKTSGSHGCINLPRSKAQVLYENIEKDVPIVCFY